MKQGKWKGKKEVDLWCNIKIIRGGRSDGCDRGSDGVIDRRWSTCIITDSVEEHMKIVFEKLQRHWAESTSRKYRNVCQSTAHFMSWCFCGWNMKQFNIVCLHPQMSISDSPASSICMFALHHQSSSSPVGPLNPDSSNMSAPMPPLDTGLYGQPMAYPKMPDGRSMEQMMDFVPYSSCSERAAQQNQQVTQKLFKPLPGEACVIVYFLQELSVIVIYCGS